MDKNYVEVDGTVLVNLKDDTLSSASQIAEGITAHLRTGEKVTGTGTGESNALRGKILAVTGDSICQGAGYDGGYAGIIGEEQGMTVQNIAQGGGQIVSVSGKFCISESISSLRSDADYILLEGGGNDAGNAVTLGTLTSGYNDTLDTTTFAGAFENMLKSALNRFPDKKIGYVMIHKCMPGFTSLSGDDAYYNIVKSACEKWGIPFLDLSILVPPLADISALAQAYTQDGYGVHPNEQGYRLFYVPQITAFLKSMITDYSLISKTITSNGTYLASSDSADGYSSVTVNIQSGDGVSRDTIATEQTVTANEYFTTLTGSEGLVEGEVYSYTVDGTEYIGMAVPNSTMLYVNSGFTYAIGDNGGNLYLVTQSTGQHTVTVEKLDLSGSGSTPSATQHTIEFEFTDETSTTLTGYWDAAFITSAITATAPSVYGGKQISLAQLDGVTWYAPTPIPVGEELIDYNEIHTASNIDNTGSIVESDAWNCVTDYTPIDSTMTFTFACNQYANIGFYDANKNPISVLVADDIKDSAEDYVAYGTLTSSRIPINAKYVILVGNTYHTNQLSLIRTA